MKSFFKGVIWLFGSIMAFGIAVGAVIATLDYFEIDFSDDVESKAEPVTIQKSSVKKKNNNKPRQISTDYLSDESKKNLDKHFKNNQQTSLKSEQPSFSETRDWILSKVKNYNREFTTHSHHPGILLDGKKAWTKWNINNNSEIGISQCEVYSIVYYEISFYNKTKRNPTTGKIISQQPYKVTTGSIEYNNFKLNSLVSATYTGFSERHNGFPSIRLDYKQKVGKNITTGYLAKGQSGYENINSNNQRIFVDFESNNENLPQRISKAFSHLSKLASNNPNCLKHVVEKEIF